MPLLSHLLHVTTYAPAVAGTTLLLALSIPPVGGAELEAQVLSGRAAVGAAIPASKTGEWRDAGPATMLSAEARLSRRWSLRLDGEWSVLNGPTAPTRQARIFDNYQDLRIAGVSLSVSYRPSEGRLAPYLLLGAGGYRLQRVDAPRNRNGTTGAIQVGLGIDGNYWRRINPFVEARAVVHFTDYASSEYAPTSHFPILVGLRIR